MKKMDGHASRAALLRELDRLWNGPAPPSVLVFPGDEGDAGKALEDLRGWLAATEGADLFGGLPGRAASLTAFTERLAGGLAGGKRSAQPVLGLFQQEFDAALASYKEKSAEAESLHFYAPSNRSPRPEQRTERELCRLLIDCLTGAFAQFRPPSDRGKPPVLALLGELAKIAPEHVEWLFHFIQTGKARNGIEPRVLLTAGESAAVLRPVFTLAARSRLVAREVRAPPQKAAQLHSHEVPSTPPFPGRATSPGAAILRRADATDRQYLACACFVPALTKGNLELLLGRERGSEAFRRLRRLVPGRFHAGPGLELPIPDLPDRELRDGLRSANPALYEIASAREATLQKIHAAVRDPSHRTLLVQLARFNRFTLPLLDEVYKESAPALRRFVELRPEFFSCQYDSFRLRKAERVLFGPCLHWISSHESDTIQQRITAAWKREIERLDAELEDLRHRIEAEDAERRQLEQTIRKAGVRIQSTSPPFTHSFPKPPHPAANRAGIGWTLLKYTAQGLGIGLLYIGIFMGDASFSLLVLAGAAVFLTAFSLPVPKSQASGVELPEMKPSVPPGLRVARIHYENLLNRHRRLLYSGRDNQERITRIEWERSEPFPPERPAAAKRTPALSGSR